MKLRSGPHSPLRSGLPSAVRGAGCASAHGASAKAIAQLNSHPVTRLCIRIFCNNKLRRLYISRRARVRAGTAHRAAEPLAHRVPGLFQNPVRLTERPIEPMTSSAGLRDVDGLGGCSIVILGSSRLYYVGGLLLGFLREFHGFGGIAAFRPESFHQLERLLQRLGIGSGGVGVLGRYVALDALVLLVDGSHPCVKVVLTLS